MVAIEAMRDINQRSNTDPSNSRKMKSIKRIFRIPPQFDIDTLCTEVGYTNLFF